MKEKKMPQILKWHPQARQLRIVLKNKFDMTPS